MSFVKFRLFELQSDSGVDKIPLGLMGVFLGLITFPANALLPSASHSIFFCELNPEREINFVNTHYTLIHLQLKH